MRDGQRQRLYDAEAQVCRQLDLAMAGARLIEVAGSTVTLPLEKRFGSLDGAQRYIDDLLGRRSFTVRYPNGAAAVLRVRPRAGGAQAHYEPPGIVALHQPAHGEAWALRELVLLHEVAHHAAFHDRPGGPAHGAAFAGVLLQLVDDRLGPEVRLLLTTAFADHRVAFTTEPREALL